MHTPRDRQTFEDAAQREINIAHGQALKVNGQVDDILDTTDTTSPTRSKQAIADEIVAEMTADKEKGLKLFSLFKALKTFR